MLVVGQVHMIYWQTRTVASTSAVLTQFNTLNGTPLLPECLYTEVRSMSNFQCSVSLILLIFVTKKEFKRCVSSCDEV